MVRKKGLSVDNLKDHKKFLQKIQSLGVDFHEELVLKTAIYRYENYWLPLFSKYSRLIPRGVAMIKFAAVHLPKKV